MSKDNYASLLELENHLIDVANGVKYQFRSWQLSENREKLFNNQYLFEIEKSNVFTQKESGYDSSVSKGKYRIKDIGK